MPQRKIPHDRHRAKEEERNVAARARLPLVGHRTAGKCHRHLIYNSQNDSIFAKIILPKWFSSEIGHLAQIPGLAPGSYFAGNGDYEVALFLVLATEFVQVDDHTIIIIYPPQPPGSSFCSGDRGQNLKLEVSRNTRAKSRAREHQAA